jgi:hypothetical protein
MLTWHYEKLVITDQLSQKQEAEWLQMVVWGRKLVGSIWTIKKGLLSKPDQGAKLALAHCDTNPIELMQIAKFIVSSLSMVSASVNLESS